MVKDRSKPDIIDYLTGGRAWRVITNPTVKSKPETEHSRTKELLETLQQNRRRRSEDATHEDDSPEAA
jgi:hypothetical protein